MTVVLGVIEAFVVAAVVGCLEALMHGLISI
jgi:hypothetical protein